MTLTDLGLLPVEAILAAHMRLRGVALHTPLQPNLHLSRRSNCEVLLKREDLQRVRSYKLRGAYNKMSQLSEPERERGIVCASAGNHAQGVAFACRQLGIQGKIFMPSPTPRQKVDKVKLFGQEKVEVVLQGDTFDDAFKAAQADCHAGNGVFIHPFDDAAIIAGQGTVGKEILEDCAQPIDYVFVPIGGGGLASGLGSYFKQLSPKTRIIGVEPAGAAAMAQSLEAGERVTLGQIDAFVDGAAVKSVGKHTFRLCQQVLDDVITIPEGMVCSTILRLYNEEAIVLEPAGALSVAALDVYADRIKGKRVVCVLSGSNNDITRTEEIKERSLEYEGLKHYFIIRFPQRAGALREFLVDVLGPRDDITRFEYTKRNNRDSGPALVGIELESKADYPDLLDRMRKNGIDYQCVNANPDLFQLLV